MIWILRPIEPWVPWYDKVFGFLVEAKDEQEARQLASNEAEGEGMNVWLDSSLTTCIPLPEARRPQVILRDHRRA
jgi:hypothetical protein